MRAERLTIVLLGVDGSDLVLLLLGQSIDFCLRFLPQTPRFFEAIWPVDFAKISADCLTSSNKSLNCKKKKKKKNGK
jgi:hypothetical protein